MWPGQPYSYMQQPQMYQQMQYQSAVPTEVIDWDAVSAIDPDLIRRTGDLTQLQPFISKFVGANMGQYESQVLTHPLAVRLCSILQVSLQYMSDVQKQLDEKVRRLETRLEDKNEEMKKLEVAFTKADELLRRKMQSTEKCPICLKKFKNFDFVDQHFERRHPEHLEEWYSLRNKRPMRNRPQKNSDIDQIVKQIADLQNTIRRDREEKARNLPVIPRAQQTKKQEPKKQGGLQQEVFKKQQELLKTEQEQEDLEMTHRDDMKSELDAAVDELGMSWTAWKQQTHKPDAPPKPAKTPKKPENDEDEFAQEFFRGNSGDNNFSSDDEKLGIAECDELKEKPNPFKFAMLQTSEIEVEPALVQTIRADEVEEQEEKKEEKPKPKKKKKGGFFRNLFRRKEKQEVSQNSPRREKKEVSAESKRTSFAKEATPKMPRQSESSSRIPDSVRRTTSLSSSRKGMTPQMQRKHDQEKRDLLREAKRFIQQREQDQFNSEVVAHAIEVIQERVVSKMKKFKPSLPPDEVAARLKKENKDFGNTYQEINDKFSHQLSAELPLPKGSPQHLEMPSDEERYVDDAVEYEYEEEEEIPEEESMELEEMTLQGGDAIEEPSPKKTKSGKHDEQEKVANPVGRKEPIRRSHFKSAGQPIGEPKLSPSKEGLLPKPAPKKKNYDISGLFEKSDFGQEEDEPLDRPTLQLTSLSSSDSLNQFDEDEFEEPKKEKPKRSTRDESYVDGSHESLFASPQKTPSAVEKKQTPKVVPAVEYEYEYEYGEEGGEPVVVKSSEHMKSSPSRRSQAEESFAGAVDHSPKITRYSPTRSSKQLDTEQMEFSGPVPKVDVKEPPKPQKSPGRGSFSSNVTSFTGEDTEAIEIESEDVPVSAPESSPSRRSSQVQQSQKPQETQAKATENKQQKNAPIEKKQASPVKQKPSPKKEDPKKPAPAKKEDPKPAREESSALSHRSARREEGSSFLGQTKKEELRRQQWKPPARVEPQPKAEEPVKKPIEEVQPEPEEQEESMMEISADDISVESSLSPPKPSPKKDVIQQRNAPSNAPTIKITRTTGESTKPAQPPRAVAPFQFDSDNDEEEEEQEVTREQPVRAAQGRVLAQAPPKEEPHEYEYEYEYEDEDEVDQSVPFAPAAPKGGMPRLINAGPLLGILKKPPPRKADVLDDESFSASKTLTLKSKLHKTFAESSAGPQDDEFEGFDRGPAPPEGGSESESGEMQSYFKPEATGQMSGWQASFGDSKFVDVDSSEGPSLLKPRSSRNKKDSFVSDDDMHV